AQDAAGDADGEHDEVALGLVLDAAWDVDDDALVQFDLLVVEGHGALAGDDVVDLVGVLVVVQFGVVDLDVVDLGGRPVLLLDQTADLPARFRPGHHLGRVATQEAGGGRHGNSLWSLIVGRRPVTGMTDEGANPLPPCYLTA